MAAQDRQRPLLEDIERRILYSADTPAGAVAAALPGQPEAAASAQSLVRPALQSSAPVELVVLDERIDDLDRLAQEIAAQVGEGRRIEFIRVGADEDGVQAITAALAGHDNVAALHLVSHGGAGQVLLGREALDGDALLLRAAEVAGWGAHLGEGADILLYGCDVASDEEGRALVQGLAVLTGADVAASDNPTGAQALGGDWVLEARTGRIETAALQAGGWGGTLALNPVGGETRVNAVVAGSQYNFQSGKVAMDAAGNFVVVWTQEQFVSILAQRYDANGAAQGTPITVADPYANEVRVAMAADGRFAVAWLVNAGVSVQRYDAAGQAQGSAITVQAGSVSGFDLAMAADGRIYVATYGNSDVTLRRYGANGVLEGTTAVTALSGIGDVAVGVDRATGQAVVSWTRQVGAGPPFVHDVFAHRVAANGTLQGSILTVASNVGYSLAVLDAAMDANGFTLTWRTSANAQDIAGRAYDASGNPLAPAFVIGSTTTGSQGVPRVVRTSGGGFVIAYSSDETGDTDVYLREYGSDGLPLAAEQRVNTTTAGGQYVPSIASDGAGRYVVTWMGNGPGDSNGIFFQRLAQQAVVTVTTESDASPSSVTAGNAAHTVDYLNANRGADGLISLREAIIAANNTAAGGLPVRIAFDIAGTGVHTISLTAALPHITRPVFIDATTDNSFAANGGRPAIVLQGVGTVGSHGLFLRAGSGGSTVRGLVVKGFDTGIGVQAGSDGNTIAGNYVGRLQPDGSLGGGLTNTWGIVLWSANNVVGGAAAADRNVTSGNTNGNIRMASVASTGNRVIGNYVGTNASGTGTSAAHSGVSVFDGASSNRIGGIAAGEGNLISGVAGDGVLMPSAGAGNAVLGNLIFGNGELGIELGNNDGVTPNDAGDIDTGPNNLQNFPVLTHVGTDGSGRSFVQGTLDSTADSYFRVELFANASADPSGHGEGQIYLGHVNVQTDASGQARFGQVLAASVPVGYWISATATRSDASYSSFTDTSEFSANIQSVQQSVLIVTNASDAVNGTTTSVAALIAAPGGDGISLREAITAVNNTVAGALPVVIGFAIPGTGVHTITLASALPTLAKPMVIDGSTDDSFALNGSRPAVVLNVNGGSNRSGLVLTSAASGSTIRGLVITNHTNAAIVIESGSNGNTIAGNYLGALDAAGNQVAVANSSYVVFVEGADNLIGGSSAGERNVISSGSGGNYGLLLFGAGASGNRVQGNYIGTNGSGDTRFGFSTVAVSVQSGAAGNLIGGPGAGQGNLIATGASAAVSFSTHGAGNVVQGNRIGVSASGTLLGGSTVGVQVGAPGGVRILDNWIAGGSQSAISLGGGGNTVQGNRIGTDLAGTANWGPQQHGILVASANNLIGGTGVGQGNTIANSGRAGSGNDGVAITASAAYTGNAILGNSIYAGSTSTGSLGIDLGNNGTTANDAGDPDTGANGLQNFPIIGAASTTGAGEVWVLGTLNSTANAPFRIELFASPSSAANNGEGRTFLGFVHVITDASGNASFSTSLSATVAAGSFITATATRAGDATFMAFTDTSEFSARVAATAMTVLVVDTASDVRDSAATTPAALLAGRGADGFISLREAIVAANGASGMTVIRFAIPGTEPHTIVLSSELPALTRPVVIDGTTDDSFAANGGRPSIVLQGSGSGTGLDLSAGSGGSTIRGLVIRGFDTGIFVDPGSDANTIAGNYIGRLDTDGSLSGSSTNVYGIIVRTVGNTIGGTLAADRNVVSGNLSANVTLDDDGATGNRVLGNYIGTDASGAVAGVGGNYGIWLVQARDNQIGGTAAGSGNLIAGHAGPGVRIQDPSATGNAVLGNSIYSNGGLGIDLEALGVTPNDLGDPDTGANNQQNFPVLALARTDGLGQLQIDGTLNSTANTHLRIELFASTQNDPSGHGEGRTYLGFVNVLTNASGNATISVTLSVGLAAGAFISATATRATDGTYTGFTDTSEFSRSVVAISTTTQNVVVVNTAADTLDGDTTSLSTLLASKGADGFISLREAITAINNTPAGSLPTRIDFAIDGDGVHTITLASALPQISRPVVIDASVDDSFAANGGRPAIVLRGNGHASGWVGLDFVSGSGGSTVRGLSILGVDIAIYLQTGSDGNTIVGNYLGPIQPDGTYTAAAGAQTTWGVAVQSANNTIGGATAADRNVISGLRTAGGGVYIIGTAATGNRVIGNTLGTDASGTPLGVGGESVIIAAGAQNNMVGGTNAGEGNRIAGSGLAGVWITQADTTGNAVLGNTIYANGGLGIDLGSNGVTANDAGDLDTGPNNLQNFPVLTLARTDGTGQLQIRGTLNSTANTHLRIELFANTANHASGHGEGQTYLGFVNVLTDASGNATFSEALAATVAAGAFISATATRATDGTYNSFTDTSEFARSVVAISTTAQNILVVDTAADTLDGDTTSLSTLLASKGADGFISLREAITAINNTPAGGLPTRIDFSIVGDGVHTIVLGSALPAITRPVVIDGTTDTASFTANGGRPAIVLDGNGANVDGLTLAAGSGGSTVRGLVVTGFRDYGVAIAAGSDGNTIAGNHLGNVGADGLQSSTLSDGGALLVAGSGNTIGGTGAADRNVIGSVGHIVQITGHDNLVQGNYVGVDASGTVALTGTQRGIASSGNGNRIEDNVVMSVNAPAIHLSGTGAQVKGNLVGIRADGSGVLGLLTTAVEIGGGGGHAVVDNWIGSTRFYSLNVSSDDNTVQGNRIGTDQAGTADWGSQFGGIWIGGNGNLIGGAAPGQGNVIAFANKAGSGLHGIRVDSGSANALLGNLIYGLHAGGTPLAIDLGPSGATANDPGDADTGANNLQNFPELQLAIRDGLGNLAVSGTLHSTANSQFRIELFAHASATASGHGVAEAYLGFVDVTTDGAGNASFSHIVTGVAVGAYVSATATRANAAFDQFSDTSEFAQSRQVLAAGPQNTVPGPQTVAEDVLAPLSGLSLVSPGASTVSVALSVEQGTLAVDLAGGASVTAGASGSAALTLTGTLAQVNAALATLAYQGDAHYHGGDTLTMASSDGTYTDTDTVAITVTPVNDAPTGTPAITGTPAEYQTLGVDVSGIADADGLGSFGYQWLRDGVAIGGATGSTYTLGHADVGAQIGVRVSYTDGDGTAESLTSAAVGPVANVNDAPTGLPVVDGGLVRGDTLTANTSGIADADGLGTFSYQWLRDGVAIAGATGSNYTLVNADVGTDISVTVSYTDGHGTTESLTSAERGPVTHVNQAPSGLPVITGTPAEDQTLTADTSAIADADGLGAFSYQWLRDGVAIAGANGATYTLGDADVGADIGVTVSYTDGLGTAESLTSAELGPIANVNDAPTGLPVVGGNLVRGDTLAADTTAIADADGLGAFSYQWLRDGVTITGATGSTYTLVNADVGSDISVTVGYTDGHGTAESLTSAARGPVTHVNQAPTGLPVVTGTPTEDQTLGVDVSGIADADGLGSFSYQWLRDGVAIVGATAGTYTLGDADVGTEISVSVTYTDGLGTAESLTSAEVGPVVNVNDAPTGLPVVGGNLVRGDTLTADTTAIADADGLGAFSYQWLRDGVAISGATGSTYTLVNADVGADISVTVSYTDGHGTAESLTSAERGPVTHVNQVSTGL